MKLQNEKWMETFKAAVKQFSPGTPANGEACAIASIRDVRDGIKEKMLAAKIDAKVIAIVESECLELMKNLCESTTKLQGFASNASAAAKAAGFESAVVSAFKDFTE